MIEVYANNPHRQIPGKNTWRWNFQMTTFTKLNKFLAGACCKLRMLDCGLYILTTSAAEMILQMTRLVLQELQLLRPMTLFFRMWDWIKTLVGSGMTIFNSFVVLRVKLVEVAGKISRRWISCGKPTTVQPEYRWQASSSCGRSMTSLRCH